MEGGQKKLTRTNSSLLRSSPTIRSSIHSISSISEEDFGNAEEEEKPHRSGSGVVRSNRSSSSSSNSTFVLFFVVLILIPLLVFVYLRKEDLPISVNLVLALGFIAVAVYLARKKRVFLIIKSSSFLKQLFFERNRRVGLLKNGGESVEWFIGSDGEGGGGGGSSKKIIREGVEFYSNGDFYEGEFHKGRSNGSGVYNYFVNGRYEGDWIDGRYDGYGIESWAKGSRYRGQYMQGLRHGYGVYKFYTGDNYAGEWFHGQSHGVGVQTCSDGSCYVGEFKCGVKHGLGCYHFRNGDKYAGEYFGDKIHGFGVYHFANGHCYEGSWHEGRKQGYGIYTFRNGETKCGEWDAGILKNPLPQLTDAVLRAVQAARKAAENAINLQQVDEQVNKTVIAANRAATAARVAAIKAVQNRMDGKFCDTDL